VKGRLFLIHWDPALARERAEALRGQGWEVETESEDGGAAYRRIKERAPDVVVVDLSRKPSHGRETALALRSAKATAALPIVFVDGEGAGLQSVREKLPDALYVQSPELAAALERFPVKTP